MIIPFESPCTGLISGATGSGKTVWISKLIKHRNKLFKNPPSNIYFFYSEYQPIYAQLEKEGVIFKHGLPDSYDDLQTDAHNVIFIDDLAEERFGRSCR